MRRNKVLNVVLVLFCILQGIKNVVDDRYVTLATPDNSRSDYKIAYLNPISSNTKSEQIHFDLLTYTKSDNTKRAYADCF